MLEVGIHHPIKQCTERDQEEIIPHELPKKLIKEPITSPLSPKIGP